jgi:hypothetical protein
MAVGMVAMTKCQKDLHKIIPDKLLRYRLILSLGLLYYSREVTATTVFHEDV